MSDLAMWALVVGFCLPPVVAVIQQPKFDSRARAVITALVCIVAGFVTVLLEGNVHSGKQLTTTVLMVFLAAIATYKGFWKPTSIAPTIESKTSP